MSRHLSPALYFFLSHDDVNGEDEEDENEKQEELKLSVYKQYLKEVQITKADKMVTHDYPQI